MTIDVGTAPRSGVVSIAILLGVAMVGLPAGADEAPPTLACDARATLSVPSGAKLVVHHPTAEQRHRFAAAKPWRFGPFDRSVYGFEWVLFYLDVPGPTEDWRTFEQADQLVRLEGPPSPWFLMTGLETNGPRVIVRQATDPQRDVVRLGTPDSTLPLFILEATTEDTRSDVSLQYLIDLRPGRPRVPAVLECVGMIAWGACGAWDAGYGSVSGPIACAWQADRGDFRCRENQGIEAPWGRRSAVRDYPLLSPGESDAVRRARVSSELAELARVASTDPTVRRDVDTIGPVHLVTSVVRAGGGSLVLLGAAGNSSSFGARFFLGVVAKDGSVQVKPVIEPDLSPSFWMPSESNGMPLVVPGTPQPGELSFRTRPLVSAERRLMILRVRVRETIPSSGVGGGPAEAVYWVGIQDRGNEVIASALRLATNTAEYTRCAGARTAPNAVAVRVLSEQPFAAELEVEPPHIVDLFAGSLVVLDAPDDGRSKPSGCPVNVRVTWSAGFEVSAPEALPPCPRVQPRLVRIDEDGEIRAAMAPKARNE